MTASTWSKGTWFGWSLMTVMAIGVAGYGAAAAWLSLSGDLPSMTHHFPDRITATAIHFGVGGLALLLGPFQFLPGLRARRPALHRWTGRVYVAACFMSGIAALVLAGTTPRGLIAQLGFGLLGIFWLITTGVALARAMQRRFAEHRRWMIRSYSLTLAAVTLRIYLPAAFAMEIPFSTSYPIISFACWVPNILVAEAMIRSGR